MFRIGEKVQAVDEIGRWEYAKIVAFDDDGGRPVVKFSGWDDSYNVRPVDGQIRAPIDFQSYSTGRGKWEHWGGINIFFY